jgi:hypothetical protein
MLRTIAGALIPELERKLPTAAYQVDDDDRIILH